MPEQHRHEKNRMFTLWSLLVLAVSLSLCASVVAIQLSYRSAQLPNRSAYSFVLVVLLVIVLTILLGMLLCAETACPVRFSIAACQPHSVAD